MMKVITGTMFNLSNGKTIVYNEQNVRFSVGDTVSYEGETYTIKTIVPPCRPDGKWSLCVLLH